MGQRRSVAGDRRRSRIAESRFRSLIVLSRASGPVDGGIEPAVTVVIAGHGNIAGAAERRRIVSHVLTPENEPLTCRRTPKGDIEFSVAGILALNRLVGRCPKCHRYLARSCAVQPPLTVRRPVDRDIGLAIPVIVGRDRYVPIDSELQDLQLQSCR